MGKAHQAQQLVGSEVHDIYIVAHPKFKLQKYSSRYRGMDWVVDWDISKSVTWRKLRATHIIGTIYCIAGEKRKKKKNKRDRCTTNELHFFVDSSRPVEVHVRPLFPAFHSVRVAGPSSVRHMSHPIRLVKGAHHTSWFIVYEKTRDSHQNLKRGSHERGSHTCQGWKWSPGWPFAPTGPNRLQLQLIKSGGSATRSESMRIDGWKDLDSSRSWSTLEH